MSGILILEQTLNGLQFGLMLFLLAAGLTLVFGIMDMINLAHGSLYMVGAYLMAAFVQATASFVLGLALAVAGTAVIGMLLEVSLFRRLYQRDHLTQVLATFAVILIANELVRLVFGSQPVLLNTPAALSGPVDLLPGLAYSSYRLLIIAVGLAVALLLYLLVAKTRTGMLVRAGASNREMATAMGVNIRTLFTFVFGVGAGLCAIAGAMLVGIVDTIGRAFLPALFREFLPPAYASNLGPAVASILIYVLMAAVLFWKPQGLFPARG